MSILSKRLHLLNALLPIVNEFSLIFTFFNDVQSSNALPPISVTLSGIVMSVRLLQFATPLYSITVTVPGIVNFSNWVQPASNASAISVVPSSNSIVFNFSQYENGPTALLLSWYNPHFSKLFGIFILSRLSQWLNVYLPKYSRFKDNFTFFNLLHDQNVLSSILTILSGTIISFNDTHS